MELPICLFVFSGLVNHICVYKISFDNLKSLKHQAPLLTQVFFISLSFDEEAVIVTGFDWQGPSNYMQVNTVEKLVTECGFSTRAVERAVLLCSMFTTLATLIIIVDFILLK
jgi:hypothetical protein